MLKYLLKRIIIFIPTLFAITLISFGISLNAPGDPVEARLGGGEVGGGKSIPESVFIEKRRELGLDLPLFYFSLQSIAYPDSLYKIPRLFERQALERLIDTYGNWDQISAYFYSLALIESAADSVSNSLTLKNKDALLTIQFTANEMRRTFKKTDLDLQFHLIDSVCQLEPGSFGPIHKRVAQSKILWERVQSEATTWKCYVPKISWYGFENQYHRWLKNVLRFDMGKSYMDGKPVLSRIMDALPWTLILNFFSVFTAYLIAIPIGVYSVRNRNTIRDRGMTTVLFLLHSLPAFWIATLMIQFLCNPEYLMWFPTSGVMSDQNPQWSFFARMADYAHHLILPTICYTYGTLAFLSRQMRVGMLDVINQDYIRTARAKGLPEGIVVWVHALRNSLLPLITNFASIFPALISGSIIIEQIFSIPGMGTLMIHAYHSKDHPIILANFFFAGVLTLVGILVSDILYAVVDPRITFDKK